MNEVDEKWTKNRPLFCVEILQRKSAWRIVRLQRSEKNANGSANADLIKMLSERFSFFIIKLGISRCHSLGVIQGKELPPHSGKLERSRREERLLFFVRSSEVFDHFP